MPEIEYVRYEDAPEGLREALADSAYAGSESRHLFYEMLANVPSIFPNRTEYFKDLMTEGVVPKGEKELAYLTVALVTETPFVAATHARYLIEDHGMTEEKITAIATGDLSVLTERERAIVSFARQVVRDPDAVSASALDSLREVGFEASGIVELLLLTCEAQTATSIVSVTGMALADRDETVPEFLPETFDL